jgi:hypothetical protein
MLKLKDVNIVARPGYFGKKRPKIEAEYVRLYGEWAECWQIGEWILNFEEAATLYDDSYYKFISEDERNLYNIVKFSECYDHDHTNIRCGIKHDSVSVPRHIQDVSVRRALVRLGTYFTGFRGPHAEYKEEELLHIRGEGTNGNWLMPGNVPFHRPDLIRPITEVENFPKWANPTSVEGFWQANKVIVIPPNSQLPVSMIGKFPSL